MDEHRSRGSPRLQFSKEELENDALARPIAKAEKAADKYEAAPPLLPLRIIRAVFLMNTMQCRTKKNPRTSGRIPRLPLCRIRGKSRSL